MVTPAWRCLDRRAGVSRRPATTHPPDFYCVEEDVRCSVGGRSTDGHLKVGGSKPRHSDKGHFARFSVCPHAFCNASSAEAMVKPVKLRTLAALSASKGDYVGVHCHWDRAGREMSFRVNQSSQHVQLRHSMAEISS